MIPLNADYMSSIFGGAIILVGPLIGGTTTS